MTETHQVDHIARLGDLRNIVPDGYMYYQKRVTPRDDLSLPNAYLKWYDIYPSDAEVTEAQRTEARAFVTAEAQRLHLADELGFVLLHRVSAGLLLMINTWRNTNEVWESAYSKALSPDHGYTLNEFPQTHRATYCVWELAPLWHERNAWTRFLSSKRDEQAKLAYINDRFEGLA